MTAIATVTAVKHESPLMAEGALQGIEAKSSVFLTDTTIPAKAAPVNEKQSLKQPLVPNFEGIPQALKDYPRWLCWKWVSKTDGKADKVPTDPASGLPINGTDPKAWMPFEVAMRAYAAAAPSGKVHGVSFTIAPLSVSGKPIQDDDATIVGVDLDNAIDANGTLAEWAQEIVDIMGSYTEVSPSGTGLHIFCTGRLKADALHKRGNVEIFHSRGALTVTGICPEWYTQKPVAPCQSALVEVYQAHIEPPDQKRRIASTNNRDLDVPALLDRARKAKNGREFVVLFDDGDTSGFPSPSEADASLCGKLAFWLANDTAAIDAAFRESALYSNTGRAEKWKRQGQSLIKKCLVEKTYQDGLKASSTANKTDAQKAVTAPAPDEWEQPILFDELPDIKPNIDGLPSPLRDFVKGVTTELQVPVEMALGTALAAYAASAQGKYRIELR